MRRSGTMLLSTGTRTGTRAGRRAVCLAALLLVLGQAAAAPFYSGNMLHDLTIQAPFGPGNVPASWSLSGDAQILNDAVRLTGEQQGKRGGLWTAKPVADMGDEWELTITFDVFGNGDKFFGDGFAVWIAQEKSVDGGPVFGAKDKWSGIGIFFDTYDNGDRASQTHPFVSVMVNDGTRNFVRGDGGLQYGIPACHTAFRSFFQGPDLPPHTQRSVAKIHMQNEKLTVDINLHQAQTWTRCIDVKGVKISKNDMHIGLTASTGDLVDNHDIYGLTFASSVAPPSPRVETKQEVQEERKAVDPNAPEEDEMAGVNEIVREADAVKLLIRQGKLHDEKLLMIQTHLKSQVEGLNAHISSMTARIKQQEEEMMEHIRHVEELAGIEIDEAVRSHSGGIHWSWPFFIFLAASIGGCAATYRKYTAAKKKHLL